MKLLKLLLLFVLLVFVTPAVATAGWWILKDRPGNWSSADWSSSGVLPRADSDRDAAVYVLAARTGGLKGAFSLHSWIVTKKPGAASYDRYDKVGWGSPIRRNSRPADGRWYSNEPYIVHEVTGKAAASLVPKVEAAIASYPYSKPGDYHVWPGPNSNSFVAHVLRSVPELGATMPPNATGRDFAAGFGAIGWSSATGDFHATLHGLAGLSLGATSGLELHLMGLVAGIDVARPALKIPAYGRWDIF
ncbi:MAG: DUF3750 domain-containing protein [Mesorhizobium sp.]|nr:DUF3750 domain-containing protein [Mesorhizobium sp.]MCO5162801.1 DUF3750 domain-containing protein [Mesorhizobium sp.]